MKLTKAHTKALLQYVAGSQPDQLDCDGCFEHVAEFVEHELFGNEIPKALQKIERHLQQCPCCSDEHSALLEGLHVIEQS